MKKQFNSSKVGGLFLFAILLTSFLTLKTEIMDAQSTIGVKNIVLVHGAFADGSTWEGVYQILAKKGYDVTIVQNPLTSLEDDVAAVNFALAKQDGPTVLVGHSWAGAVITQAGISDKVASLVYISAFLPDAGETVLQLASSFAPAPENGILPPDEFGNIYYDKAKFHTGFAADLPKEKAALMYAAQGSWAAKCSITPITQVAWKVKPSYAVVSMEDKNIVPELQRKMYNRAGSIVTEVKASHSAYISQPKVIADVIEMAAKGGKPAKVQALTPQPEIKRVDLQQQDINIPGYSVIQDRVDFPPGTAFGKHTHPGEEIIYVLEGTLEYQVGSKPPVTLKVGDVLFIPSGVTHSVKNVGGSNAKELATYVVENGKPLVTLIK